MLSSTISFEELGVVDAPEEPEFDSITEFAAEFTGAPVSLVSIVETDKDRQYFKSAYGLPEPWRSRRVTTLSHSFCTHVRATGAPLIIEDAREDPSLKDSAAVAELNVVAYLGVPILGVAREPIGALCAIDARPRRWSAAEFAKLEKLSWMVNDQIQLRASLLIRNQQIDELRRLAATDPLTGISNRRAFMAAAAREVALLGHDHADAALVIADLDHFKRINDAHGHDAGDLVLKAVAERLEAASRRHIDLVARFGGEEFVLLLSDISATAAMEAAERLRRDLSAAPIALPGGRHASVTASFGIASLRAAGLDLAEGLRRADAALYVAKTQGRDRVALHGAADSAPKEL